MADVTDTDAAVDEPENGRMTLVEHLAELRSRLFKSIVAVVVGWLLWGLVANVAFAVGTAASPGSFGEQGQPVTTGALATFVALAFVWSVVAGAVAARIDRVRTRGTLLTLTLFRLSISASIVVIVVVASVGCALFVVVALLRPWFLFGRGR